MDRLTDSHKESLRFLVKAVRAGSLSEEFSVYWTRRGALIHGYEKDQHLELASLSPLTLDILTDEGLLYSRASHETRSSTFGSSVTQRVHEQHRTCFITPEGFRAVDREFSPAVDLKVNRPPIEISESLAAFRTDFPDSTQLAFIMMQFGRSDAHKRILAGIEAALDPHGLTALRADDKQYHDDLYFNILTYLHGVRFGIAVFERIEEDAFNPNVSLEVGYMLGLKKNVCFLKDQTLHTLHTDLVGKLYRTFDPQDPEGTIPPELYSWMDQKGFITRR